MRLVATSMVALEVFFLKLKLFIHTGIAGGIFTLKLQSEQEKGRQCRPFSCLYLLLRYLSMEAAASLPAPIAEITVAAPVTASPPA